MFSGIGTLLSERSGTQVMLPTVEHTEQRTLCRAGAFGLSLVGMLLRYSHGGSVAPLLVRSMSRSNGDAGSIADAGSIRFEGSVR